MAMSLPKAEPALPRSVSSLEEDILIRSLLLAHNPDGRDLASEILLQIIENVFCYASTPELRFDSVAKDNIDQIESVGLEEPLGLIIYKISREMIYQRHGEGNLHTKTVALLDLLGNYRWRAKIVLIIAAFAFSYGEFWLVLQLYQDNPLAGSIAMLKQLPTDFSVFKPQIKALNSLVKKMIDVTHLIIRFDGLLVSHIKIEEEAMESAKRHLCLAVYWITRSALRSSSHIKDLMAMKPKRVCRNAAALATWELSSLLFKLSDIFGLLQKEVDVCQQKIEKKITRKLVNLFDGTHINNQEALLMLFALKDNLPFKESSSQAEVGISRFKEKVLIFYISKPDYHLPEELFLLIHQTYHHPHYQNIERLYDVISVPIACTASCTDSQQQNYELVSNFLPWYSLKNLQLINAAAADFIKRAWHYRYDPIMVVMNPKGAITNLDATDMVKIWGSKAYPFSYSREQELWQHEQWSLMLMFDQLDPILSQWIQEGRNICIYGGADSVWIQEFNAKIEEILRKGIQLETVYVGKRKLSSQVRKIAATSRSQNLTIIKIQFFWLRLESMRRSRLRAGYKVETDIILQEVSGLLDFDDNERGWGVLGDGLSTDIARLEGEMLMVCLDLFPLWGKNVANWGIVNAIRMAVQPPITALPCSHKGVIAFEESLLRKTFFCEMCMRPMKNFVIYD